MSSIFSPTGATIYTPRGTGGLPGAKTTDGGVSSLALNDTSKAITFGVAFSSAPAVQAQIVLPDNTQPGIDCWVDESTRTTAGATILFGNAIPAAGFKLSWSAIGS